MTCAGVLCGRTQRERMPPRSHSQTCVREVRNVGQSIKLIMARALDGQVALVTGATRGIGKGIAVQLGLAGATVYITGRTLSEAGDGSLVKTAREVEVAGGRCIPVQCDHRKDDDVEALFQRIESEQNGRLDILVNNAYSAIMKCRDAVDVPFWKLPTTIWDDVNNVGLRNHYTCSAIGARMMVARKNGLIVNISSFGGMRYMFCVAYGAGKAAFDRLAVDGAKDLRPYNVAAISLWPGPIQTEQLIGVMKEDRGRGVLGMVNDCGATPQYIGKCVVNLALDPNRMDKSGKIHFAPDLGNYYHFLDIDGGVPQNMRSLRSWLRWNGYDTISSYIPGCIKLPGWLISILLSKF